MSGEKEKEEAGKKLGETDESEVEGAAGDLVGLPADGDRLHLHGRDGEEARYLEVAEVRVTKGGARVRGHWE